MNIHSNIMSLPKVSIITPSYNQDKFIEETILSIINQNYPNLEYIIIDGGSTDNSVEIIKKYEKHLAYWVSEKDSGQSEAINKGFKKATGEIVCWLNSDDILMPEALNKVVVYFQKHQNVDILNGYTIVIDEKSNILYNFFMLKQKKWYAQHGIYYVAQPSMFWKRKIFDSIGLLREDFHSAMDKELLIRMFENDFKIGYLKKILAGFRLHETSKTYLRDRAKLGTKEKAQKEDDTLIIGKLYGKEYIQNPKLIFKLVYRFEKFIRGLYFKKWSFTKSWKGKSVKELNKNNCHYL